MAFDYSYLPRDFTFGRTLGNSNGSRVLFAKSFIISLPTMQSDLHYSSINVILHTGLPGYQSSASSIGVESAQVQVPMSHRLGELSCNVIVIQPVAPVNTWYLYTHSC